jgi:hypothetical protein
MSTTTANKILVQKGIRESSLLVLVILALLTGSFLRISLFFTYPLVAILVLLQFRLKLMIVVGFLFALVALSFLLSFLNGSFLEYKAMSLYHMVPFLLLLFAVPSNKSMQESSLLKWFILFLTILALINDVVGAYQFIDHPSDDSFIGIYSRYSLSLYGLVALNTVLFAWYFSLYLETRSKTRLLTSLFFLLATVMGFYGAGLAALLFAFSIAFSKFKLISIIKSLLIAVSAFFLLYFLTVWLRPEASTYYKASATKLLSIDKKDGPRKLLSYYNYGLGYTSDTKDFLFGSGPGTFNSRSAFVVGSPSYFTQFSFIKSKQQPFYFKYFIYPLWNETNTSQALFQDGFRNQPFSSLLTFLGEYGLIFTIFFAIAVYFYFKRVQMPVNNATSSRSLKWLFRFLLFFLLILLVIDNYMEYPEVIILITVLLKLVHIEIEKRNLIPS